MILVFGVRPLNSCQKQRDPFANVKEKVNNGLTSRSNGCGKKVGHLMGKYRVATSFAYVINLFEVVFIFVML